MEKNEVKVQEELLVEKLKKLKKQQELLSEEKKKIIEELDDMVIYQNEDGSWTRFTKIDNLQELQEKGQVFRSTSLERYTTKVEILKNTPKELKKESEES